jgi:hypothetical protein
MAITREARTERKENATNNNRRQPRRIKIMRRMKSKEKENLHKKIRR